MALHTRELPQLDGTLLLTDGGIETTLIFHEGLELPEFASFDLLKDESGRAILRRYFHRYAELAAKHGVGLLLESPTWRANPNWATKVGYTLAELDAVNRRAIALMHEVREAYAQRVEPIVVSGCVGPEGDGYSPETLLTAEDARAYHARQVDVFAACGVDLVTAITMTYADEAIGVTRAARTAGIPVAISFTVETDGALPSGQSLADAIAEVDARTDGGPAYFMVNCAHPSHFAAVLEPGAAWVERIRGLRSNASAKSHAELDEATELDEGDPAELGSDHAALASVLTAVSVLGGCCGTDHRHVGEIARAWLSATRPNATVVKQPS